MRWEERSSLVREKAPPKREMTELTEVKAKLKADAMAGGAETLGNRAAGGTSE